MKKHRHPKRRGHLALLLELVPFASLGQHTGYDVASTTLNEEYVALVEAQLCQGALLSQG